MSNIWKGENVTLRRAVQQDAVLYVDENGNHNTETEKLYDKIEMPYSNEDCKHIIEKINKGNEGSDNYLFTVVDNNNTPIGQIITFDCDKRMGCFKFGLFFNSASRGKGYAKQAVNIMLDFYFNQLRYHKANVYIYDFNEVSQKFHQKLGFKKEGVLREVAFIDGKYIDAVYYGITSNEFNELYGM